MKYTSMVFALFCIISSSSIAEVAMAQSASMLKDNKKCEVFLKLIGPLIYAEALVGGNYEGAWICAVASKPLFTLSEEISVEGLEGLIIESNASHSFFCGVCEGEGPVKGHQIPIQNTFALSFFC